MDLFQFYDTEFIINRLRSKSHPQSIDKTNLIAPVKAILVWLFRVKTIIRGSFKEVQNQNDILIAPTTASPACKIC